MTTMTIDDWILNLIDSHLESIDISEVCPACDANNSHLTWGEGDCVNFECLECGSTWFADHWSIDDAGQPVQTEPRDLGMILDFES